MGAGKGRARRASAKSDWQYVPVGHGFNARGYPVREGREILLKKTEDPKDSAKLSLRNLLLKMDLFDANVEMLVQDSNPHRGPSTCKGRLKTSGAGYLCIGDTVVENLFEGLEGEVRVEMRDLDDPLGGVWDALPEFDDLRPVSF
jgi:hypothetical protein